MKKNLTEKEKKQVKKMQFGQPARRVADESSPVDLGEEEGSYVDQLEKANKAKETDDKTH